MMLLFQRLFRGVRGCNQTVVDYIRREDNTRDGLAIGTTRDSNEAGICHSANHIWYTSNNTGGYNVIEVKFQLILSRYCVIVFF